MPWFFIFCRALYQQVTTSYPNISTIVADSGYRTPAIAKLIIDNNRTPIFSYKRPMTKDGFFKKYEYIYDEYYDCYVCTNNEDWNIVLLIEEVENIRHTIETKEIYSLRSQDFLLTRKNYMEWDIHNIEG